MKKIKRVQILIFISALLLIFASNVGAAPADQDIAYAMDKSTIYISSNGEAYYSGNMYLGSIIKHNSNKFEKNDFLLILKNTRKLYNIVGNNKGQLGLGNKINQPLFVEVDQIAEADENMNDGIISYEISEYMKEADFLHEFGDIYAGRWVNRNGRVNISIVNLSKQDMAISAIKEKFPESNNLKFVNAKHSYFELDKIKNDISLKMNNDVYMKLGIKINSVGIDDEYNVIKVGLGVDNTAIRGLFKKHISDFPDIEFRQEYERFDE